MPDESVDVMGAIASRLCSLPAEARGRGGDSHWGSIRAGQYIDYAIQQGAFQGPEWISLRIGIEEPSRLRQFDVTFYEAVREILHQDICGCSIEVFDRLCVGIADAIEKERKGLNDDFPPAADLKPADYFTSQAGLTADRLLKAQKDGRLKHSEKRHGRWFHSEKEVRHLWPDAMPE